MDVSKRERERKEESVWILGEPIKNNRQREQKMGGIDVPGFKKLDQQD